MSRVLNKLLMINKGVHKVPNIKNITTRYQERQKMDSHPNSCPDIVWMDLEMTGLDVTKDKILEISCLITDEKLNIKNEGISFTINHPESTFEQMNEWCMKHHWESGLVENCLKSQITNEKGEQLILDYLKQHIPKGKCPLAGNSVYMDRLFLRLLMPYVDEYMHYRIIDVSTVKELAKRWNTNLCNAAPEKKFAHRTLDDIHDSIEELKYYKQKIFDQLSDEVKSSS